MYVLHTARLKSQSFDIKSSSMICDRRYGPSGMSISKSAVDIRIDFRFDFVSVSGFNFDFNSNLNVDAIRVDHGFWPAMLASSLFVSPSDCQASAQWEGFLGPLCRATIS